MSSLVKVPRIPAVMTRSRPSTSDFVILLLTVVFVVERVRRRRIPPKPRYHRTQILRKEDNAVEELALTFGQRLSDYSRFIPSY